MKALYHTNLAEGGRTIQGDVLNKESDLNEVVRNSVVLTNVM